MKLICYEGCHDFWIDGWIPQLPRFFNKKATLTWDITMARRSTYILPGDEQKDWNKGGGQTFHWFDHLIDTAMWGFRYNVISGIFEYSAYCHVDGAKVLGHSEQRSADKEVLLTSEFDEKVRITLYTNFTKKLYNFDFNGQRKVSIPFTHNLTLGKEITANFGGDNSAPSKIIVDIKTTY